MKKLILLLLVLVFIWGCSTGNGTNSQGGQGTEKPAASDNATIKEKDPKLLPEGKNAHVVVIGTEIEGMYLARAAKDEGLSVLVLDPREKPGGQLIQGEMLFLDEPTDDAQKTMTQGRIKKLFDRFKNGEIRNIEHFTTYFNEVMDGIPLESGITIVDVKKETDDKNGRTKVSGLTYKTAAGEEKTVTADYFVENTDFTALTHLLGGKRLPGVETIFNASDVDYMASSIMMKFKGVDWNKFKSEVMALGKEERFEKYGGETTVTDTFTWGFGNVGQEYESTRDDIFLRGLNALNQLNGEVLINALLIYDVVPSDNERIAEAVKLGQEETDLIVDHLRDMLPGWENAEVNGYPDYLYIRDFDRYETDYILQATDVMGGEMFWDNVSIASYPLDNQGIKSSPWGVGLGNPDKYGMPLRSFILKDYANVIVAGKNVGATAAAYGSARIQANTSLAGEVIGIILAQIDGEKQLVELNEEDMKKMHAYLKKEYKINVSSVKAKNKIADYTDAEREQLNSGKQVTKK
ncbi:FAD-dependent oxidoreductase [Paenibacillus sp. MY03]|uniref:FAD-dependent oxidoreductase n=1 Tax=Paenibacillus sp. MY03 TaxID=302980 RepID=UPI00211B360A|nr:FAD-dependent oxidoreductase [Paenibacillus sp. MY03]